jgi:hypothetical protein
LRVEEPEPDRVRRPHDIDEHRRIEREAEPVSGQDVEAFVAQRRRPGEWVEDLLHVGTDDLSRAATQTRDPATAVDGQSDLLGRDPGTS